MNKDFRTAIIWIASLVGLVSLIFLLFGKHKEPVAPLQASVPPAAVVPAFIDSIQYPIPGVFIREYPGRPPLSYGFYEVPPNGENWIADNEIWIRDDDGEEKLLVKSGAIKDYPFAQSEKFPFTGISGLSRPVLSLDNKKVYFMSSAWAVSDAIFSADVSNGKLQLVSDGNSLDVITVGPYKGKLIVSKHKYYQPDGGSYDHYYIITDTNKELKDLGVDFNKSEYLP